ncbi:MAG TPA: BON domain-containing protein [Candidatus Binatia bacterium]|jgi:hyperosmotically inducible protein
MNGTSRIKYSVLAIVLAAALAAPAHAATPDAWITTKTKLALLTTEGVRGTAIHVDTILGKVTLHGKVRSAEEKTKAESIAKKTDGVQEVRNLLQVVTAEREKAVQLSDDDLKQRVEKAIKADSSLKDSSISVKSVNKGVVLLDGTAKTLSAHLRAVEDAAWVPGVERVASEIKSPDTLADAEIWREPTTKTSAKESGIRDAASDTWITSATKMRLLADSRTPGLDINVETRAGVVTLFGIVPSQDAKAAAEVDARKVSGVKSVVNELQVVPPGKQATVKARDEDIEREVKKAFEKSDLKDVSVEVKNGVVRLKGTVSSGTRRLDAAVLARSVEGVRAIKDDLRVATAKA